jgi:hypothetical protein
MRDGILREAGGTGRGEVGCCCVDVVVLMDGDGDDGTEFRQVGIGSGRFRSSRPIRQAIPLVANDL